MPSGPRLEHVTLENVRAACQLRLEPGQEHLVAPVAYSLADAYAARDSAGSQGRGYGRFAVDALAAEALRRGQRRMTVSYHPGDGGPEGFYARLGFRPTGELIQDEVVAERMLAPAPAT